jgi:hypothetical protein
MIGIGLVFAKWDEISGYKERKRKMTRTCIQITYESDGWKYEGVYQDSKKHAYNLDILFRHKDGSYSVLSNREYVILPYNLEGSMFDGYKIRRASSEPFIW